MNLLPLQIMGLDTLDFFYQAGTQGMWCYKRLLDPVSSYLWITQRSAKPWVTVWADQDTVYIQ